MLLSTRDFLLLLLLLLLSCRIWCIGCWSVLPTAIRRTVTISIAADAARTCVLC
jgi:hypothetical protein